jgi:Domain of unknown function (DUF4149)
VTTDNNTVLRSERARANADAFHGSHSTVRFKTVNYNDRMVALRYAAVLAIAVWMGGLLALGTVAAPAIFDVVAAHHVADGRVLSGAIFGEAFRRFHLISYGCGGLLLLSLLVRAVLGPRPRRFWIRLGIAIMMLATTLYSGLVLTKSIEAIQREIGIGVAVASLPPADPRRVTFGRLHAQSTLLQLVPIVGGIVLIFWELKE